MYTEKDISFDDFVDVVFGGIILAEKSVPFSVDTDASAFDVLIDILHSGMKLLFADGMGRIRVSALSESDIEGLILRFRSMSVLLMFSQDHSLHTESYIESTGDLADSFLILHDKETGYNYKVSFDLL